MGDTDEWKTYSSPEEQTTGGRDEDGYWWRLPSLGATEGRSEIDMLWTMSEASWKRRGLTGILNESFPFSNSVDNISFGDSDSQEDSHVELKSCSPGTVGSMSSDQSSPLNPSEVSFSDWVKDGVAVENSLLPKNTVGCSGGGIEADGVQDAEVDVSVKSAGCEAGGVVDVKSANGQGEGTEEMELEVVLKAEVVGSEPIGRGKDVLPEFQLLPGPPRRDVSGIRPQSAREAKENVPPTTTAQHRASNMYKKSKLPQKITTAAGPASLRLSRGSTSLLPSRDSTEYLGKDRKKDNLDTTGAYSIISKSTLSQVNPARQFGGSHLVKPASRLPLGSTRLPLGSTHSSKLVGPGQPGISVDALKRVNTIKLGSANPLPRASQPMACTSRQRGTQPRSRSKTITKTKNTLLSNCLPSITSFPEVSRLNQFPLRNRKMPAIKGLRGDPQSTVVSLPGTIARATADISAAVTSSPLSSNLLPVTVATTCTKTRSHHDQSTRR